MPKDGRTQASLHAFGLFRAPDFFALSVHHQFAVIGQLKTAHVARGRLGRVCVPPRRVTLVVHDQVAVSLHAQTDSV